MLVLVLYCFALALIAVGMAFLIYGDCRDVRLRALAGFAREPRQTPAAAGNPAMTIRDAVPSAGFAIDEAEENAGR